MTDEEIMRAALLAIRGTTVSVRDTGVKHAAQRAFDISAVALAVCPTTEKGKADRRWQAERASVIEQLRIGNGWPTGIPST